ncbi:MAG: hypothetical protein RID90_14995, partial [Marinovum algicola]
MSGDKPDFPSFRRPLASGPARASAPWPGGSIGDDPESGAEGDTGDPAAPPGGGPPAASPPPAPSPAAPPQAGSDPAVLEALDRLAARLDRLEGQMARLAEGRPPIPPAGAAGLAAR